MKLSKRKLSEADAEEELGLTESSYGLLDSSDDEEEVDENDYESSEGSETDEEHQIQRNEEQKNPQLSPLYSKISDPNIKEDNDTSDEEDIRNTVGNIPMQWYENFPHIGYNLDGKKIMKPVRNMDELDKFLDKMDNPDYWRTVYDETTGRDHKLTEDEVQLINRLKTGKFYDSSIDPYAPYVDFFTHEKMIHPINNIPAHKRSFTPSLNEKLKVGKLVHAIKMGWLKPRKGRKEEEEEQPKFFDLWAESKEEKLTHSQIARRKMHIPAPKVKLPGHEASYNPPPEYLFTEEEKLAWEEADPDTRKINFIPQKYDSWRKVPQYSRFVQDAFARCLDLYLCPRQQKMRVHVDPEDLIPKLPKPSDLQPFPTVQALCYKGHEGLVRSISVHGTGQWIASGSDDKTIRVWEVTTGRCLRTISTRDVVKCVAWCPNLSVCLLAAVVSDTVVIINPYVGDRLICQATDQLLHMFEEEVKETDEQETIESNKLIPWNVTEPGKEFKEGIRLELPHSKPVSKVTWHGKGDYFATVLPGNGHMQVLLHQLTKRRSQNPFSKCKGLVQCVLFHPNRPFLFVATQTYIRVYNLVKQALTKKLIANAKWISSIAVHPKGDDLLVGSYDCRLMWFDMDLSVKPYQTLRYHKKAIRACCFHTKYPLFASSSDDGSIIVSHGMVYSDLLQNPLIVPVKVLKGHRVERNLGVLDCCFHPTQPWIFSSAADNTIRLFT